MGVFSRRKGGTVLPNLSRKIERVTSVLLSISEGSGLRVEGQYLSLSLCDDLSHRITMAPGLCGGSHA